MGASQDLVGRRFGRLVVVEFETKDKAGNVVWSCRCDCGNLHSVTTSRLNAGIVKSCGCLRKETSPQNGRYRVLSGNKYGELTALENRGQIPRKNWWLCRCSCGKELLVSSFDLREGKITMCTQCQRKQRKDKMPHE